MHVGLRARACRSHFLPGLAVTRAGVPGSECRVEGPEGGFCSAVSNPKSDSGWWRALGTQETSLTHVKGSPLAGLFWRVPGVLDPDAVSRALPCDEVRSR